MPRWAHTARASSTSRGPQHRPPADAAVPRASYRRIVMPTTSWPCSTRSAAAVALSTPPDSAATTSGRAPGPWAETAAESAVGRTEDMTNDATPAGTLLIAGADVVDSMSDVVGAAQPV